jgi:hypothetical protein
MVQNVRPLPLGQGLLDKGRQEVGIGMRELAIFNCRFLVADCRVPILLISHRFSFQPLEHDFGHALHN